MLWWLVTTIANISHFRNDLGGRFSQRPHSIQSVDYSDDESDSDDGVSRDRHTTIPSGTDTFVGDHTAIFDCCGGVVNGRVEGAGVAPSETLIPVDSSGHTCNGKDRDNLEVEVYTSKNRLARKLGGGKINKNNSHRPFRERLYNYWYPVATNIGRKYKDENVIILGGFDHISPSAIDKMCLDDKGQYTHNNRRSRRKPLAIRVAMEVQTKMGERLSREGPIGKANEKAVRSCALSIMTEWRVPKAKQCDVISYIIELSFITSMRTIRAEQLLETGNRTNRLRADDSRLHRWNPRWWFNNHYSEDNI